MTPNVMVGAYFQYGFVFNGDECDGCSLSNMRFGGQVHYHFMPWQSADPWVGAGIGYEWMSMEEPASRGGRSGGIRGFEFLNLQFGVDLLPSQNLNMGLGPFVSLSMAEYTRLTVEDGAIEQSGDIEGSKLHQWLTLGIRGTFVP